MEFILLKFIFRFFAWSFGIGTPFSIIMDSMNMGKSQFGVAHNNLQGRRVENLLFQFARVGQTNQPDDQIVKLLFIDFLVGIVDRDAD